jgi:MFS family permease
MALLADLAFVLLLPEGPVMNLVLVGLFGAAIFAMYPVIVAHANDHAPPGTSIQVSGGLLMVYGLGSIIGPLVAGLAMAELGPRGLFVTTIAAHVLMIAFTIWRISIRAPVAEADKTAFQITLPARAATPETAALAAVRTRPRRWTRRGPEPPGDTSPEEVRDSDETQEDDATRG